ncbi:hypothetical protein TNCV_2282541 [Trichonephila clavipes]|nr:hypothetical protein TNCV_2282541 [Trichonephila clavipes]
MQLHIHFQSPELSPIQSEFFPPQPTEVRLLHAIGPSHSLSGHTSSPAPKPSEHRNAHVIARYGTEESEPHS